LIDWWCIAVSPDLVYLVTPCVHLICTAAMCTAQNMNELMKIFIAFVVCHTQNTFTLKEIFLIFNKLFPTKRNAVLFVCRAPTLLAACIKVGRPPGLHTHTLCDIDQVLCPLAKALWIYPVVHSGLARVALAFSSCCSQETAGHPLRRKVFINALGGKERHFTLKSAGQRILGIARANDRLWSVVAAVLSSLSLHLK
jgi:hypothetical protein